MSSYIFPKSMSNHKEILVICSQYMHSAHYMEMKWKCSEMDDSIVTYSFLAFQGSMKIHEIT